MHPKKMNFTKFLICLLVIFLSLAGLSIQAKEQTQLAQAPSKQANTTSSTSKTVKVKRLLTGARSTGQALSKSEPPTYLLALIAGLLGFVAFAPARFVHQSVQLQEKPAKPKKRPASRTTKNSSALKKKPISKKAAKKTTKTTKKAAAKPDPAEEYIDEIEAVAAIEEQLDAEENLDLIDVKLEGKISGRGHKQANRVATKRKR